MEATGDTIVGPITGADNGGQAGPILQHGLGKQKQPLSDSENAAASSVCLTDIRISRKETRAEKESALSGSSSGRIGRL